MLTIISRKRFRFMKPGGGLLAGDGSLGKEKQFAEMYFETQPGAVQNTFGEPQQAPEYIKQDPTWANAMKDGDIAEISVKKGATDTDKAIAAAQRQTGLTEATRPGDDQFNHETDEEKKVREESEAEKVRLSKTELSKMTKADLQSHALEVHDTELDPALTKDEMIDHVSKLQKQAAK